MPLAARMRFDIALRSCLAQRGPKKGDLSRFIEGAVKWRVFDQTAAGVREKFADLPADKVQALVHEACAGMRADMAAGHKRQARLMRVVIDTEVFVSALLATGSCTAELIVC